MPWLDHFETTPTLAQLDVLLDIWHQIELDLACESTLEVLSAKEFPVSLLTSATRVSCSRRVPPDIDDIRIGELRWSAVRYLQKSGIFLECELVKGAKPHQDLIRIHTTPLAVKLKLAELGRDLPGLGSLRVAGRRVFIGHGHSDVWLRLERFLSDRLLLEPLEFNRTVFAGAAVKERLQELLARADFAFLVMTAEEQRSGGTLHARDNVIHEAGLFQGKLGFRRAILLVEDGTEGFSNISGLGYISFPRGDIMASAEEIRRVLEREGLISQGQGLR